MQQYELVDFGRGRKLERFGPYVLDRPSPTVEGVPLACPDAWRVADARFERGEADQERWISEEQVPATWVLNCGTFQLQLKLTPFGHVGVFPEQAENWQWLERQIERARQSRGELSVLNLFAYTGGSTLAAAAAGARVVHVDSAKNTIGLARSNAELSGLADRPIRWIVEDAATFVRREVRRGNRYDAVILDPPSYGHGPKGEVWRIEEHLPDLLRGCAELTGANPAFLLCTSHTPGIDASALLGLCTAAGFDAAGGVASDRHLTARDGRKLRAGVVARIAPSLSRRDE